MIFSDYIVFCTFKSAEGNTMCIKNHGHTSAYLEFFSTGEKIAVYNGPTMEKKAEYTVKAFEAIDEDNIKLETEETIVQHNEGDLIENLSAQCDVTIKNCSFAKANSYIRFQSRGKAMKMILTNCGRVDAKDVDIERHTEVKTKLHVN